MSELRRAPLGAALALALAAGARAADECRVPDPPAIPDGATAGDDEMLRTRAAVAAFVAASDAYASCLGEQIDSAEPNAPVAALKERHDGALARMNEVAERFNAQLEIWKQRKD